jgi:hypothetical protein
LWSGNKSANVVSEIAKLLVVSPKPFVAIHFRKYQAVTCTVHLFSRKLSENFGCWSDKLCEDSVYESIQAIFSGVKKGVGQGPVGSSNRGEIKQLLEVTK